MKQSQYNFFFKLDNGHYIAFNALKNGLAVILPDLVTAITSLQTGQVPNLTQPQLVELEKGGFICQDDFSELGLLEMRQDMSRYANNYLALSIAPTLNCNLACQYCFEKQTDLTITAEVIQSLVDYVNGYIKQGINCFNVTWYGGEPLLCFDAIEIISRQFIDICQKNNVAYSAYLISNGVLFTKDKAEKCKELKIGGIQITLDGIKEIHDARRPFKDGSGSFEQIYNNIQATVGIIPLSIRINTDATNIDSVLRFMDTLKNNQWFHANYGKNITVHYGHVRPYTSNCRCAKEEILQAGDFWQHEFNLSRYLNEHGFGFNKYPNLSKGCGATHLNSYVVGPAGELYKCWNHLGDTTKKVGTLSAPIQPNALYIDYMTDSFTKDKECCQCNVLPLCMGGCIDVRQKFKKGELSGKDCTGWKFYIEESLREYYLSKINQKPSSC